jgi:hypothetical protein
MGYEESKLLNSFLAARWPTRPAWKRVRLGPSPAPGAGPEFEVTKRWADAVLFDGERIWIIEAKLKADPGAFGQLKLYRQLFKETPEFVTFQDKPIELAVVQPLYDPAFQQLGEAEGIHVFVHVPG